MKLIKFLAFMIVFFTFTFNCLAEIIEISNFKQAEHILNNLNSEDLIVFDIDEVVIQPVDQIFHPHHKQNLATYYQDLQNKINGEEFKELLSIINLQQQFKLVDPKIKDLLKNFSQRSIPTIALTHTGTGQFGKIPDVVTWRIDTLKNLGISFASFTSYPDKIYANLQGKFGTAEFRSGLLFTGYVNKGQVLHNFLLTNNLQPKRIIFFDDRINNLQDVDKAVADLRMKIKYIGLQYTTVSKQPFANLNIDKTNYQFEILFKEKRWLADKQIKRFGKRR